MPLVPVQFTATVLELNKIFVDCLDDNGRLLVILQPA